MATSMLDTYVEAYAQGLVVLPQQRESRLAPLVRTENAVRGRNISFHRISKATQVAHTTMGSVTPTENSTMSTRFATPTNWCYGELVDKAELVRMLTDPQSAILANAQMSLARQKDQWIIDAAIGTAGVYTDAGAFSGTQAMLAGQVDAAAAALTFERVQSTKELFDANEIPEEGRVWVIGSQQLNRDLLAMSECTSSDFNPNHVLPNGQIKGQWMGFNWVRSEMLAKTAAVRHTFAFHRDAVGLGLNLDITAEASKNPERRYRYHLYAETIGGAVRIDDYGVVQVDCTEA